MINICLIKSFKDMKQNLTQFQGKIVISSIVVEDFNTSFLVIDRKKVDRKSSKFVENLNNTTKKLR